jgi:hypothetical protein
MKVAKARCFDLNVPLTQRMKKVGTGYLKSEKDYRIVPSLIPTYFKIILCIP